MDAKLSPGASHTSICALRCLRRTIKGSWLDDAWLYSRLTVSQILIGNHYNRAIEAHEVTLQALFDLWFETFVIGMMSFATLTQCINGDDPFIIPEGYTDR